MLTTVLSSAAAFSVSLRLSLSLSPTPVRPMEPGWALLARDQHDFSNPGEK